MKISGLEDLSSATMNTRMFLSNCMMVDVTGGGVSIHIHSTQVCTSSFSTVHPCREEVIPLKASIALSASLLNRKS